MASSIVSLLIISSLATFFLIFPISAASSNNNGGGGFSVNLYHRDSPTSTAVNPSSSAAGTTTTLYDRVARALRRSNARHASYAHSSSLSRLAFVSTSVDYSPSSSPIQSDIIPNGGDYLMTLSVGSPAKKIKAIADTGSDLIWMQCKPCVSCYEQDDPLFDPRLSSTYRNISCTSTSCSALPQMSCSHSNTCQYQYSYGDQSYARGTLAAETLTFDTTRSSQTNISKVIFGCGHENGGTFPREADGLIGLGAGPLSLVRQIDSRINGKFSYCLVPLLDENTTSVLSFGPDSIPSGEGSVSTPMTIMQETFYYLTLETITVGDTTIQVSSSSSISMDSGNIVIDSGTTLTYLDESVFDELASAVAKAVDLPKAEDPTGNFKVCYEGSNPEKEGIPDMIFEFTGAKLKLTGLNTFLPVAKGVLCLAFMPSNLGISLYGNVAQQNYKVGYDLAGMSVSFARSNCGADQ